MQEIKIKGIAMATGDFYENAIYRGSKRKFIAGITKRRLINITLDRSEILINPDFIISIAF